MELFNLTIGVLLGFQLIGGLYCLVRLLNNLDNSFMPLRIKKQYADDVKLFFGRSIIFGFVLLVVNLIW